MFFFPLASVYVNMQAFLLIPGERIQAGTEDLASAVEANMAATQNAEDEEDWSLKYSIDEDCHCLSLYIECIHVLFVSVWTDKFIIFPQTSLLHLP